MNSIIEQDLTLLLFVPATQYYHIKNKHLYYMIEGPLSVLSVVHNGSLIPPVPNGIITLICFSVSINVHVFNEIQYTVGTNLSIKQN